MEPKKFPIQNNQAEFANSSLINLIISAAIKSVDPYRLVDQHIVLSNGFVCIGENTYKDIRKLIVIAIGKASLAMTQAVVDKLGEKISGGVCVCKVLPQKLPEWKNIELLQGAHPIPDKKSIRAGQRIQANLADLDKNDLVLVLISGGASALVASPVSPVSLEELQETNQYLLRSGASINEVNAVRKHLESLKGGGLLRLTHPARVHALILSDVIGNDMSVIASGPTVADISTFADAWKVLERYELLNMLPEGVVNRINQGMKGQIHETVKPDEFVSMNVTNQIVGSNQHAIESVLNIAKTNGVDAVCLSNQLTGEARLAAQWFVEESMGRIVNIKKPALTIAGGETTVTIKGNGKGGRNLELALAVVKALGARQGSALVTLATDGEDGPTDAAGAIVTGETMQKAQKLGLDPDLYLQNNDAYTFFDLVGGLIKTGSTGTNVNDLTFFFQF